MALLTLPTFVIGLGGIGNRVVRLLHERFRSVGMALPETIRLRSIDTATQEEVKNLPPLPDSMFTVLDDFEGDPIIERLDLWPEVKRWWKWPPEAYSIGYIINGAQARRPVGRLAFFNRFERLHRDLKADFQHPREVRIQEMLANAGELQDFRHTPRVILVGSISGGTGSGMMIDVGLLARRMLLELNYKKATIQAILGLPSVIEMNSQDGNSTTGLGRKVNAFSALREIDALQDTQTLRELEIEYPSPVHRFSPEPPLFNETYLFTDRKKDGFGFTEQNDVLQRVAHFVFGQIALGTGKKTLDLMSNVSDAFDPSQQRVADGLKAIYGSFGVEWLETPEQALLLAWTEQTARKVAENLHDFSYHDGQRRNLRSTVLSRLVGQFEPYSFAAAIAAASAEDLATISGIPEIEPLVTQIGAATTKQELEASLQSFINQIPGLLEPLKRRGNRLPDPSAERDWTRTLTAELAADPEFRLGGARRTLDEAARILEAISMTPQGAEDASASVIANCTRGFLRKIDPGPAQDWARQVFLRRVKGVIANTVGKRATAFAAICRFRAQEQVAVIQDAVKQAAERLEAEVRGWSSRQTELWLHLEEDIQAAVQRNKDTVVKNVTADISADLKTFLQGMGEKAGAELRGLAGALFSKRLKEALQAEGANATDRPADAVRRIKARVEVCQPLAQLVNHPNDLRAIMGGVRHHDLRFVVTSIEEPGAGSLREWGRSLPGSNGGVAQGFEVVSGEDAQRDDALYMTFGWPLWLFTEVRECRRAYLQVEKTEPRKTEFSTAMGEWPELKKNQIDQFDAKSTELLFAQAVVLDTIRIERQNRVSFSRQVFGVQPDATSLDDARMVFRIRGLNRSAEAWMERRRENLRSLRAELLGECQRWSERLAAETSDIPKSVRPDLEEIVQTVRKDIEDWVVR